jgi:predicted PurR-regulated permease PerM
MPDADPSSRPFALVLPWRTIFKIFAAIALVWLWLHLVQWFLVVVVAVLLAVTLNPLVVRFERRGLSRGGATALVGVLILALVGGFLWLTWSSLSEQARYTLEHLEEYQAAILNRLPGWLQNAIGAQNTAEIHARAAALALSFGQSVASAIGVTLLAFILTLYLLVEGETTRDWLVAFAPKHRRGKVEQTLVECERVIFAYVSGNLILSFIAFVCTLVALSLLKVPAALLLAVVAGVSDMLPVIGFILGAFPTILLALTVSPTTALLVAAFYIAYNTVETYVIGPWAYGDRLKLSNVVIILAFIVGAEIAGVIGALIALPVAAIYPAIEHIWLRDQLGADTVREHKQIENADS